MEEDEAVDFVLVWDGSDEQSISKEAAKKREIFEDNLAKEGLILVQERDDRRNLTFVKIRATLDVLKRYSEILKYRMPLKEIPVYMEDRNFLFKQSIVTMKSWFCCLFNCFRVPPSLSPPKNKTYTAVYSRDKEYLFDVDESESEFFTSSVRARIIQFILNRTRYAWQPENFESDGKSDFKFGINRMLKSHVYRAAYPLHDGALNTPGSQRYLLSKEWASFGKCFKMQPLWAVKEYFGIQIALYFAWVGFYTRMLIPASILGIVCFIFGASTIDEDVYSNDVCNHRLNITMCPLCDNFCDYWKIHKACFHAKITHLFDNDTTVVFATFMSFWSALFLEYWKRYIATLTYHWDLTGFDTRDQHPRPEYLARLKHVKKTKVNPVTRVPEPLVSFFKHKLPYMFVSISTVILMVFLAAAAVVAVIVYRLAVKLAFSRVANENPESQSLGMMVVNITAALINLIFILFFNWLYEGVAEKLTDLETHRTQLEYDDSYAFKIYLLKFVNYYSSIIYIAFFKGIFVGSPAKFIKLFGQWRQEECKIGCMPELCIQLSVVMIGKQLANAMFEIFWPAMRNWRNASEVAEISDEDTEDKQWAQDLNLVSWNKRTLVDEYLEMVIQYGFVTIFVAAFPLAPFFALLNNILEVRVDAKKVLKFYKRPVPMRVKNIGVWYPIMEFIGKLAVLTNAFIIAITSKFIPKMVYRFGLFESDDPRYGTLDGFLEHSLASFNTSELESPPLPHVMKRNYEVCRYSTYRYGYLADPELKYKPNEFYWRVWLARVIFILVFENVVASIVLMIRWMVPDISQNLKDKIHREEYSINEFIIQYELNRIKESQKCGSNGSTLTLKSLSEESLFTKNLNSENMVQQKLSRANLEGAGGALMKNNLHKAGKSINGDDNNREGTFASYQDDFENEEPEEKADEQLQDPQFEETIEAEDAEVIEAEPENPETPENEDAPENEEEPEAENPENEEENQEESENVENAEEKEEEAAEEAAEEKEEEPAEEPAEEKEEEPAEEAAEEKEEEPVEEPAEEKEEEPVEEPAEEKEEEPGEEAAEEKEEEPTEEAAEEKEEEPAENSENGNEEPGEEKAEEKGEEPTDENTEDNDEKEEEPKEENENVDTDKGSKDETTMKIKTE